jgi:hypothetical protein
MVMMMMMKSQLESLVPMAADYDSFMVLVEDRKSFKASNQVKTAKTAKHSSKIQPHHILSSE